MSRLLVSAVALGLLLAVALASGAQATSHPARFEGTIESEVGTLSFELRPDVTAPGIAIAEGNYLVVGGPVEPGGYIPRNVEFSADGIFVELVDACDQTGRSYLIAVNSAGPPSTLELTDNLTGRSGSFDFPSSAGDGDPDALPFVAIEDPLGPCESRGSPEPVALPDIAAVGSYDGIGRRCPDFTAPLDFRETTPGGGYDRVDFRGQRNDVISTLPFAATDTSKVFDELHIFVTGPDGEARGVTFGGAQGMLPRERKLVKSMGQRMDEIIADLDKGLSTEVKQKDADKAVTRLARRLGVKKGGCAYVADFEFDSSVEEDDLAALLEALAPLDGSPEASARFRVELVGLEDETIELSGTQGAQDRSELFAADGLIVQAIDGCALNDRFWVFSGANELTEFEIRVTDTADGEVRTYSGPRNGAGFQGFGALDTDAFESCP